MPDLTSYKRHRNFDMDGNRLIDFHGLTRHSLATNVQNIMVILDGWLHS